jgi:hypothetical protein
MSPHRTALGVAVVAASLAACAGEPRGDHELREQTQSFCASLQNALERARDGVVAGQARVSPYGDIRGALLAWHAELTFCASIRAGDTVALRDRFGVASDGADQLLSRPIAELDAQARAKLRDQLADMAAVAQAVVALPLE